MYRLPHVCTVHPSVERVATPTPCSSHIRKMIHSRPKHVKSTEVEVPRDFSSNSLGMLLAHPPMNYQAHVTVASFSKANLIPARSFATKTEPKEAKENPAEEEENEEAPSAPEKTIKKKEKATPETILRVRVTEAVTSRSMNDPTTPRVTIAHLETLINSGKNDYTLVDLREEEDMNGEPAIPSAIRIPVPSKDTATTFTTYMYMNPLQWEIKFKVPKLTNQSKQIIFYSNTGVRSDIVTQVAVKELGLTNAVSLIGGARLWNKYKNPDTLMASASSNAAAASPSTSL
mmetsp:Transcript_11830/g.16407  ORF Transcript_11830/g.16407 Transcript_11830/m.16407 type:complete len:288 (-) Transcript_11830:276-1139(-)